MFSQQMSVTLTPVDKVLVTIISQMYTDVFVIVGTMVITVKKVTFNLDAYTSHQIYVCYKDI